MKTSFQQKLQLGIFGFALLWTFTGCATLSEPTEPEPPRPIETKELAPVEAAPAIPEEPRVVGPKEVEVEPPPEPAYYIHTVRWPGESVSIIAKWYTGNLENWKVLAQANPELDPNRIFIGNKIRIPENLLKTREPMPQEFVARFTPKPKEESPPSKTAPPPLSEEEEPKLFGPKQYPPKKLNVE
jgi:hypothetical protein